MTPKIIVILLIIAAVAKTWPTSKPRIHPESYSQIGQVRQQPSLSYYSSGPLRINLGYPSGRMKWPNERIRHPVSKFSSMLHKMHHGKFVGAGSSKEQESPGARWTPASGNRLKVYRMGPEVRDRIFESMKFRENVNSLKDAKKRLKEALAIHHKRLANKGSGLGFAPHLAIGSSLFTMNENHVIVKKPGTENRPILKPKPVPTATVEVRLEENQVKPNADPEETRTTPKAQDHLVSGIQFTSATNWSKGVGTENDRTTPKSEPQTETKSVETVTEVPVIREEMIEHDGGLTEAATVAGVTTDPWYQEREGIARPDLEGTSDAIIFPDDQIISGVETSMGLVPEDQQGIVTRVVFDTSDEPEEQEATVVPNNSWVSHETSLVPVTITDAGENSVTTVAPDIIRDLEDTKVDAILADVRGEPIRSVTLDMVPLDRDYLDTSPASEVVSDIQEGAESAAPTPDDTRSYAPSDTEATGLLELIPDIRDDSGTRNDSEEGKVNVILEDRRVPESESSPVETITDVQEDSVTTTALETIRDLENEKVETILTEVRGEPVKSVMLDMVSFDRDDLQTSLVSKDASEVQGLAEMDATTSGTNSNAHSHDETTTITDTVSVIRTVSEILSTGEPNHEVQAVPESIVVSDVIPIKSFSDTDTTTDSEMGPDIRGIYETSTIPEMDFDAQDISETIRSQESLDVSGVAEAATIPDIVPDLRGIPEAVTLADTVTETQENTEGTVFGFSIDDLQEPPTEINTNIKIIHQTEDISEATTTFGTIPELRGATETSVNSGDISYVSERTESSTVQDIVSEYSTVTEPTIVRILPEESTISATEIDLRESSETTIVPEFLGPRETIRLHSTEEMSEVVTIPNAEGNNQRWPEVTAVSGILSESKWQEQATESSEITPVFRDSTSTTAVPEVTVDVRDDLETTTTPNVEESDWKGVEEYLTDLDLMAEVRGSAETLTNVVKNTTILDMASGIRGAPEVTTEAEVESKSSEVSEPITTTENVPAVRSGSKTTGIPEVVAGIEEEKATVTDMDGVSSVQDTTGTIILSEPNRDIVESVTDSEMITKIDSISDSTTVSEMSILSELMPEVRGVLVTTSALEDIDERESYESSTSSVLAPSVQETAETTVDPGSTMRINVVDDTTTIQEVDSDVRRTLETSTTSDSVASVEGAVDPTVISYENPQIREVARTTIVPEKQDALETTTIPETVPHVRQGTSEAAAILDVRTVSGTSETLEINADFQTVPATSTISGAEYNAREVPQTTITSDIDSQLRGFSETSTYTSVGENVEGVPETTMSSEMIPDYGEVDKAASTLDAVENLGGVSETTPTSFTVPYVRGSPETTTIIDIVDDLETPSEEQTLPQTISDLGQFAEITMNPEVIRDVEDPETPTSPELVPDVRGLPLSTIAPDVELDFARETVTETNMKSETTVEVRELTETTTIPEVVVLETTRMTGLIDDLTETVEYSTVSEIIPNVRGFSETVHPETTTEPEARDVLQSTTISEPVPEVRWSFETIAPTDLEPEIGAAPEAITDSVTEPNFREFSETSTFSEPVAQTTEVPNFMSPELRGLSETSTASDIDPDVKHRHLPETTIIPRTRTTQAQSVFETMTIPEDVYENVQLLDSTTLSDAIPEIPELPETTTLPEVVPVVRELPEITTLLEVVPEDGELPGRTTVSYVIPDNRELPESTTVPEVIPAVRELPESTTLPEVVPALRELPETTTLLGVVPEDRELADSTTLADVISEDPKLPETTTILELVPEDRELPESSTQSDLIPEDREISEPTTLPEAVSEVRELSETTTVVELVPKDRELPKSSTRSDLIPEDREIPEPTDLPEVVPEVGELPETIVSEVGLEDRELSETTTLPEVVPEVRELPETTTFLGVVPEDREPADSTTLADVISEDSKLTETTTILELVPEDRELPESSTQSDLIPEDREIPETTTLPEVVSEVQELSETTTVVELVPEDRELPKSSTRSDLIPEDREIPETTDLPEVVPEVGELPGTIVSEVGLEDRELPETTTLPEVVPEVRELPETTAFPEMVPEAWEVPDSATLADVIPEDRELPETTTLSDEASEDRELSATISPSAVDPNSHEASEVVAISSMAPELREVIETVMDENEAVESELPSSVTVAPDDLDARESSEGLTLPIAMTISEPYELQGSPERLQDDEEEAPRTKTVSGSTVSSAEIDSTIRSLVEIISRSDIPESQSRESSISAKRDRGDSNPEELSASDDVTVTPQNLARSLVAAHENTLDPDHIFTSLAPNERDLLQQIPHVIEQLRQGQVSTEDRLMLRRVFGNLWPLLDAESTRESDQPMSFNLANLLFEARQRLLNPEDSAGITQLPDLYSRKR